jgi:transcriptional regulator with XRE-family HTH domain
MIIGIVMSVQSIKSWRADKGLTLEAAAQLVGVVSKNPRSTWRNWETGKCTPPLEVINKISAISEGRITFYDWLEAQREHRAGPVATKIAA